ncbi:MAG: PLP-dependent aminotransferase family protein [Methylococcaceae bacterium]|jgi:GntR family transcriptional regulator/MocR family aminotransferase
MDPIFELSLVLPTRDSRNLLRALHHQLRAAIVNGKLQAGLRLPATRKLAALAGVSRNTAVAAYDLLQNQGYITIRPGAGAFVADNTSRLERHNTSISDSRADACLSAFWRNPPALPAPFQPPYRFDFRMGLSDKSAFPFQVWQRLLLRSQRSLSKAPTAYSDPQGQAPLREAIATHVSTIRAVAVLADDIVVTAGTQQALDILARILVTAGQSTVAFEDPGYSPARIAFAAAGANVVAVPVDENGIIVEKIPPGTHIIYVTPTHQFPLGYTMSIARRVALLNFAQQQGAVVIEDDYDSEFRYKGKPLDALQNLDNNGSVFYLGTFSKSLFPSLRLGFVLTPPWARHAVVAAKRFNDWHSPILEQETLAAFIAEGHLVRHIRKMRKIYEERRTVLTTAIKRHCGDLLESIPAVCGLHLTALAKGNIQATTIAAQAEKIGMGLYTLDRYPIAGNGQNGFAFGLGLIEAEQVDEAVRCLAGLMFDAKAISKR